MSMKKGLIGMEYLVLNEAWEEVTALGVLQDGLAKTASPARATHHRAQPPLRYHPTRGTWRREVAIAGVELGLLANLPS
jgi:hypothetical protein